MKRFLALTGAAIALAGVVATAGCQAKDRTGRADRDGDTVSTTQQQPAAPGKGGATTGGRPVDVSGVDGDLASVDSLLDETDTQLAESSAPDAD
ncbi:hypothetical protein F4553_004290 [Allocatelliglobosispora scoriae]|uniref:Uncharacterized protein n=1 Tax=Allocatelliglobosispora scoriae TaxID=643052 RepID=A0A841BVZ6_9ACTN|nr:hypothetical protein [Allocatelliglobosispora scoriae]MBB5870911.1 hypothetical protein [Allocatelliglobosispora scoriae]